MKETLISKNLKFSGQFCDVYEDDVRLANGHETKRFLITHPGASAIIPLIKINGNEEIMLVKQFRYAANDYL